MSKCWFDSITPDLLARASMPDQQFESPTVDFGKPNPQRQGARLDEFGSSDLFDHAQRGDR
jgi:hypothetical protein